MRKGTIKGIENGTKDGIVKEAVPKLSEEQLKQISEAKKQCEQYVGKYAIMLLEQYLFAMNERNKRIGEIVGKKMSYQ